MFDDGTPDFDAAADKGDNARPRFYSKPVKNNFRSESEGRPVFEDKEFVEILVPGDRKTVVDTLVKDEHKRRWPREYAAFKAGQEVPVEGTPLEEWPQITRSQVEELKFAHIRTVEQLASLPDDPLNRSVSMGGFALREKAQRYLEALNGNAQTEALAAESARKDEIIAEQKRQYEALLERVAAIEAQTKGVTA